MTGLSEKVKQTFRERAIYPVQNNSIMSLLAVWNVVTLKFFTRRDADDILYAQMEDLVSSSQFPDPVAEPRHLLLGG
ncbi:hypothetical protein B0A49_11063 [Cryomyces minteri]|uniref:Uncharacterized protein n=1 Tax=Cryomyces minteri TaxID=331657 RepID=A0A4U0VTL2_9PEZI|nr:hypothetical protein B0A49_11063 [Cryomyces minteri]